MVWILVPTLAAWFFVGFGVPGLFAQGFNENDRSEAENTIADIAARLTAGIDGAPDYAGLEEDFGRLDFILSGLKVRAEAREHGLAPPSFASIYGACAQIRSAQTETEEREQSLACGEPYLPLMNARAKRDETKKVHDKLQVRIFNQIMTAMTKALLMGFDVGLARADKFILMAVDTIITASESTDGKELDSLLPKGSFFQEHKQEAIQRLKRWCDGQDHKCSGEGKNQQEIRIILESISLRALVEYKDIAGRELSLSAEEVARQERDDDRRVASCEEASGRVAHLAQLEVYCSRVAGMPTWSPQPPLSAEPEPPTREPSGAADLEGDLEDILDDEPTEAPDDFDLEALLSRFDSIHSELVQIAYRGQRFRDKFVQETNDLSADPCRNGIAAYGYDQALFALDQHGAMIETVRELATSIMLLLGLEPSPPPGVGASVLRRVSEVGANQGRLERAVAEMEGLLARFACDPQEVAEIGSQVSQPGLDPDTLETGSFEICGDGADNDNDGFIDEDCAATGSANVTITVTDSGNEKDDIFDLQVLSFGDLGNTPKGGVRTYSLTLPPGSYVAVLTTLDDGEDTGTFTISFGGRASGGGGSGELPLGGSQSFSFVVQ